MGQRGNFIDIPTDCPLKDERLGWTADTQVFVNTAYFLIDSYNFYKKYMNDLRGDQTMYYNWNIPMFSPSFKKPGKEGAVWADAGIIIPWNIYMNYGDKTLLENNYPMMKDYVESLTKRDLEQGDKNLIIGGFFMGIG